MGMIAKPWGLCLLAPTPGGCSCLRAAPSRAGLSVYSPPRLKCRTSLPFIKFRKQKPFFFSNICIYYFLIEFVKSCFRFTAKLSTRYIYWVLMGGSWILLNAFSTSFDLIMYFFSLSLPLWWIPLSGFECWTSLAHLEEIPLCRGISFHMPLE